MASAAQDGAPTAAAASPAAGASSISESAAAAAVRTTTLPLSNGVAIPQVGLGVYLASSGEETESMIRWALAAGYRHVDTAAIYGNEESVGRALRESSVPRSEIFVTTKLWRDDEGYESAKKAFDLSLKKLGLDYVDLYLIHYPLPGRRLEAWRALEEIYESGRAKAIGVSNFCENHMRELLETARIKPHVNQIELSPYFVRSGLVDLCRANGVVVEAYSPLTKGWKLSDKKLVAIAAKYDRTPAQILIRYCIERGLVVIPKSSKEHRIVENADVFDFKITDADMESLNAFDEDLVTGWDPRQES